ncbi:hypothetical protein [Streptomyces sp. NPDC099088]|uniref:hypothetical protein n=1 Tax=Streptomyces sp. NPDC099088 TaxID=3366101 RepID=UPI0037F78A17
MEPLNVSRREHDRRSQEPLRTLPRVFEFAPQDTQGTHDTSCDLGIREVAPDPFVKTGTDQVLCHTICPLPIQQK